MVAFIFIEAHLFFPPTGECHDRLDQMDGVNSKVCVGIVIGTIVMNHVAVFTVTDLSKYKLRTPYRADDVYRRKPLWTWTWRIFLPLTAFLSLLFCSSDGWKSLW